MAEQPERSPYYEPPEGGLGGEGDIVDETVLAPTTDGEIERGVYEALDLDPDIDPTFIVVAVEQGVVVLAGRVHSPEERQRALKAAELVHGVQRVEDRLAD
jgi:osmotically-inducible protein OsmY